MSKKYAQRIILNIIEVVQGQTGGDAPSTVAETDSGENLRDKFDGNQEVAFERNELIPVRVPVPTSLAVAAQNKGVIRNAIRNIVAVGANSILYVIGHSDPDSKRLAGLDAGDWAELLGERETFRLVKRIHFVGCHAAGEAKSAQAATSTRGTLSFAVTGFFSFAAVVHEKLKGFGIRTEVASYCSYVRISPFGEIRAGFDEKGSRTRHAPATKVVYSWDGESTRSMTFPHM